MILLEPTKLYLLKTPRPLCLSCKHRQNPQRYLGFHSYSPLAHFQECHWEITWGQLRGCQPQSQTQTDHNKKQVTLAIMSPTPFLAWRACGSSSTHNSLNFYSPSIHLDGCPDFSPVAISLLFHALRLGVWVFLALFFSLTIIICFVFI